MVDFVHLYALFSQNKRSSTKQPKQTEIWNLHNTCLLMCTLFVLSQAEALGTAIGHAANLIALCRRGNGCAAAACAIRGAAASLVPQNCWTGLFLTMCRGAVHSEFH